MEYFIKAISTSKNDASLNIKENEIMFGITPESSANLPNPAELFLGSFSACILKNVERFSILMNFKYSFLLFIFLLFNIFFAFKYVVDKTDLFKVFNFIF